MDFRRLEVFVEVVKSGTFSEAAEKLFLTQPTVSSHISALEKELGISLFERRGRRVVLTPAGKEFFPRAQDLIGLKNKTFNQMAAFSEAIKGEVKIIASSTPGIYLLPDLFAGFRKRYPGVSFNVFLTDSQEAREKVRHYQFDLGIVGEGGEEKNLSFFPLKKDRLIGICPEDHRFAGRTVEAGEIKKEPFILRSPGSATRKVFEKKFEQAGVFLRELNILLEINNLEGIKANVRQGHGISIISEMAVNPGEGIEKFFIKNLSMERNIQGIYNDQRILAPWAEKFLDYLKERSGENE